MPNKNTQGGSRDNNNIIRNKEKRDHETRDSDRDEKSWNRPDRRNPPKEK